MKHMAAILQALSLNNLSAANIGALLALPVAMGGLDDRCYVGCCLRLQDRSQPYTLMEIRPPKASPKSTGKGLVLAARMIPDPALDFAELGLLPMGLENVGIAQLVGREQVATFPFEKLSQVPVSLRVPSSMRLP